MTRSGLLYFMRCFHASQSLSQPWLRIRRPDHHGQRHVQVQENRRDSQGSHCLGVPLRGPDGKIVSAKVEQKAAVDFLCHVLLDCRAVFDAKAHLVAIQA